MKSSVMTDYDVARAFLEDIVIPYIEYGSDEDINLDAASFKALVVGYLAGARFRRMQVSKLQGAINTFTSALERAERSDSNEYRTCAKVSALIEKLASCLPQEIANPNENRSPLESAASW